MKMNKLQGLVATYYDLASSENEFITAGRMAKKMIVKEIGCPLWCASRIVEILGNKDTWLPCPENMHRHGNLPTNASEVLEQSLKSLNIRYTKVDYGFGGVSFQI